MHKIKEGDHPDEPVVSTAMVLFSLRGWVARVPLCQNVRAPHFPRVFARSGAVPSFLQTFEARYAVSLSRKLSAKISSDNCWLTGVYAHDPVQLRTLNVETKQHSLTLKDLRRRSLVFMS